MRRSHVVMDTEYTAWEGSQQRRWTGPGERREIVQIAAIKFDAEGREIGRFLCYVKPVFNPVLSDYFTDLTGITQEKVDADGITFAQAMNAYIEFSRGVDNWCYGRDDEIMAQNAQWFGLAFPMPAFMDARPLVAITGRDPAVWTSGTVHRIAGIERPGAREHDAMDDCLSLSAFIHAVSGDLDIYNPNRTAA